jgi:tripartite-type tricarboxylate transporter receptor subunit TctC
VYKPPTTTRRGPIRLAVGFPPGPALPDVPTLAEAGIKTADVDLAFWFAVFSPKGLPEPIRAKLEAAIERTMKNPTVRERLAALDITPGFGPGSALKIQLQNEIKNWKTFIEIKDIKAQ